VLPKDTRFTLILAQTQRERARERQSTDLVDLAVDTEVLAGAKRHHTCAGAKGRPLHLSHTNIEKESERERESERARERKRERERESERERERERESERAGDRTQTLLTWSLTQRFWREPRDTTRVLAPKGVRFIS
jgi:hypothetical protein